VHEVGHVVYIDLAVVQVFLLKELEKEFQVLAVGAEAVPGGPAVALEPSEPHDGKEGFAVRDNQHISGFPTRSCNRFHPH